MFTNGFVGGICSIVIVKPSTGVVMLESSARWQRQVAVAAELAMAPVADVVVSAEALVGLPCIVRMQRCRTPVQVLLEPD